MGVDRLLSSGAYRSLLGLRLAMLSNQSAVTSTLAYTVRELLDRGVKVEYVLSPEHGFWAEYYAGEEFPDAYDRTLGVTVRSIYGRRAEGSGFDALRDVDGVIVDIQDVGVRFYTYVSALLETMDHSARYGTNKVVVLDRPNPLGCLAVEGPYLEAEYRSYVGYYDVPLRYGLTLGELAILYNSEANLGLDLEVVKMEGYHRSMDAMDLDAPWVPPSPAIPDRETVFTYPSLALLEGTNVSEGRGTYSPFKLFGAPFIDPPKLAARLNSLRLPGVAFRPTYFMPRHSKFSGQRCGGVYVHVLQRRVVRVVELGLRVLEAIYELYPEGLVFLRAGDKFYLDLLLGTSRARRSLVGGRLNEYLESLASGVREFRERAREAFLYPHGFGPDAGARGRSL